LILLSIDIHGTKGPTYHFINEADERLQILFYGEMERILILQIHGYPENLPDLLNGEKSPYFRFFSSSPESTEPTTEQYGKTLSLVRKAISVP